MSFQQIKKDYVGALLSRI